MRARAIRNIQINYAGENYSGSYEVADGLIKVSSAYGSKSSPATGNSPGPVALDLLKQIA